MYDIYQEINTQLNTLGLPVYYEDFISSATTYPCLSYYFISNSQSALGDTQNIEDISVRITVWSKSGMADTISTAQQVDTLMHSLLAKRISVDDLFLSDHLFKKVISYKLVAIEEI